MGNNGFSGPSSLLYHLRPPTSFQSVRKFGPSQAWEPEPDPVLGHRHFVIAAEASSGEGVVNAAEAHHAEGRALGSP